MLPRIRIILSFDHELCLGETTSYSKDLFEPTDNLLQLAGQLEVPVTLFTDVLCAMRFKEWDTKGFLDPYRQQLARTLQKGNEVQLHLHPHWLDSKFRDGKFLPSTSFALHHFKNHSWPDNIAGIVSRGVNFLTTICRETEPGYKCVAYRAGGYNLAPATAIILSALYDNGIRIDSSITKGFYFRSALSEVDFRVMPKRANWLISKDGPIHKEAPEGIFEIPIACAPRGPLNNIPFLARRVAFRKRRHQAAGKGIHEGRVDGVDKIRRLFPRSAWQLGFDAAYAQTLSGLIGILRHYIGAHREEDEIICAAISHPKHMGDYELRFMQAFVSEARKVFGERLEFTTYRQIYDEKLSAGQIGTIRKGSKGPLEAQ